MDAYNDDTLNHHNIITHVGIGWVNYGTIFIKKISLRTTN